MKSKIECNIENITKAEVETILRNLLFEKEEIEKKIGIINLKIQIYKSINEIKKTQK